MGDIDGECESSGPGARARVRYRCSVRCTWRIGLWFELASGSVGRLG